MREIDSESGDSLKDTAGDRRLSEALRGLAASSGRGAPAEVGAGLATAFRRHHARRRLVRRVSIGAIAAGLAVVVGLMSLGSRSPHQAPAKEMVQEQPTGVPVKPPEPATSRQGFTKRTSSGEEAREAESHEQQPCCFSSPVPGLAGIRPGGSGGRTSHCSSAGARQRTLADGRAG